MRVLAASHDSAMKDLEAHFANQYKVRKQEQTQWYNQLKEADQATHIRKEALAMGLLEHEELQGPTPKQTKQAIPVRSHSVVSVKKRGCSVSRSEDIEYINNIAPPHHPPPKVKDGSITPTKALVVECALPVPKEHAPSSMLVDEPVSPTPHAISSTTIPLPPAQAELTPAVILAEAMRASTKSPSPTPSEEMFNHKLNENFSAINNTLLAIMKHLEQLESQNPQKSVAAQPFPAITKSPSPPRIPTKEKGKGRAEPMIPLPPKKPPATTTLSPMVALGIKHMREAGASESQIMEEIAKTEKAFPALPSLPPSNKTEILCPLFTAVLAKAPDASPDGFTKVQKMLTTTPSKLANRFVRAGIASSTEITISWNGGIGGTEEEIFQHSTPATMNGNFVYTIQGHFSPKEIQGFEDSLCAPFPGVYIVVPMDRWMFVHLRSIPTKDSRGSVWSQSNLCDALEENACFQGICLTVAPRWLHDDLVTASMEKATVTFAYIDDESNTITKLAQKSKIAMFGKFILFIPVVTFSSDFGPSLFLSALSPLSRSTSPYHTQITSDCPFPFSLSHITPIVNRP